MSEEVDFCLFFGGGVKGPLPTTSHYYLGPCNDPRQRISFHVEELFQIAFPMSD